MSPSRVIVYTVITGDYDELKPPKVTPELCDYVCFSDNQHLAARHWEVRPLPRTLDDPVRSARYAKLHPHLLFPEYELSAWVDGSLRILGDVQQMVADNLSSARLALYSHPKRDCIYQAGQQCIKTHKDDPELITEQLERYRRAGYPAHAGLWATGVLLRSHHDEATRRLMEAWWSEIEQYSRRDQLSFPYVCRRSGYPFGTLPGRIGDRRYFARTGHRKKSSV